MKRIILMLILATQLLPSGYSSDDEAAAGKKKKLSKRELKRQSKEGADTLTAEEEDQLKMRRRQVIEEILMAKLLEGEVGYHAGRYESLKIIKKLPIEIILEKKWQKVISRIEKEMEGKKTNEEKFFVLMYILRTAMIGSAEKDETVIKDIQANIQEALDLFPKHQKKSDAEEEKD